LSSSRALSVTHELLKDTVLDDKRFVVVGHADTQPFGPNDSSQSRAQNRRVEVVIRQGQDEGAIATIEDINTDAIQMSQEQ
jgi:chemotaxis protein MotB